MSCKFGLKYMIALLVLAVLSTAAFSGVAAGASASKIYVADYDDNMVYVVDPATGSLLKNISVESHPMKVIADPTGTQAFVLCEGTGNISVISIVQDKVVRTLVAGDQPKSMAVSPDGMKLYVTSADNYAVYVVNTTSGSREKSIRMGSGASDIVFTTEGMACVANSNDNAIMIIDSSGVKSVKTLNVGQWPEGIGIDPLNRQALVLGFVDGSVTIIDVNGWEVVKKTQIGGNPLNIAFDVSRGVFYVTDPSAGTVRLVNTQGEASQFASVPQAKDVIVERGGDRVFVASPDNGTISLVSTAGPAKPITYKIGHKPTSIMLIYAAASGATATPEPSYTPYVPATPTPTTVPTSAVTPTPLNSPTPTPVSGVLPFLAIGLAGIGIALRPRRRA